MADRSRVDGGAGDLRPPHTKHGPAQPDEDDGLKRWTVIILGLAKKEGRKILSDVQYDHVVEVLRRLVDFGNSEEIGDLDIRSIESFFELREKGGVLGKINLRVYFGTIPEGHELVIAKAYKKEDDGATPRHVVILVENRLEEYRCGGLRKATTAHQDAAPGR